MQTLLIMKISAFLLLVACIKIQANGFAQFVTLSEKNVSLQKVFKQIQKQVPYDFVYNAELLQEAGKIDIDVRNAPLDEALQLCLKNKPLQYIIFDKTIVIKRLDKAPSQPLSLLETAPPDLISGVVVDEAGNGVAYASVVIDGEEGAANKTSRTGTQTDASGFFTLSILIMKNAILRVTAVSYAPFQLAVNTQTGKLRIVLKRAQEDLVETVVTGYSKKKISEITGALQTFSGADLREGVSTVNTLAMLKGKAAGLYIVETSTSNGSVANRGQVIMRGQASFNDANNTNFGPLIVLDGVITIANNLQDVVAANEIESITLLKDAASTAIYGSRAAQGVLVVTTQRGTVGKPSIRLNMNYGKVQSNRLVSYMNTAQATAHIRKYTEALYKATPNLQSRYGSYQNYFNTTRIFTDAEEKTNYDWANEVFYPDGRQKDISLSLSSGNDRTKFYSSFDWLRQDGTILDDNLDRKSVRFNIDQKVTDKLSVSFNVNALLDKYTASSGESNSYAVQPWVSPYDANGQLRDSIPSHRYLATGARSVLYSSNPLYHHEWNTTITNRQNYLGTGIIKYAVAPWLSVQSANTYQYTYNNVNTYRDPRTFRGKYAGSGSERYVINGELWLNDTKSRYFLTSNLLSFNKKFGEHQVTALAGQEYGKTHQENIAVSGYNTPYPGERNLGAFLSYGNGGETYFYLLDNLPIPVNSLPTLEKASFSLFSEINDNYRGKYLASFSFRRDASTNFGREKRYGNFYSISGAWILSKENFMRSVKPLNNLKLRASYGTSGREAGADFLNFTTYKESTDYGYNSISSTGAAIQRLANDEITWETTYTTDIGADIGLWNRVNLTLSLYNRLSKGLLQTITLPSYQGSLSQVRNIGELQNRGIDIILSTINVQSRNFTWTTDFNISFNSNKLTKIYGDSLQDGATRAYYRYKGEDINTLRAIKYAGVNPDNGRPLFERVMADKSVVLVDSIPLVKLDGIRGYAKLGSATPKFFGGFTNTFRYRQFTLSTLFNFVYGNKIMNNGIRNWISPTSWQSGQNNIQPDKSIRFWSGPGDTEANYPNFYEADATGTLWAKRGAVNLNSSLIYQDASYIRLRNIRLAYGVPGTFLSKASIKSATIYVSSDNVFVIKSRELLASDPEGATIGTSVNNNYIGASVFSSMPRRFMAGISIGF